MIESFYSGRAGLTAHETSMTVVSNNISNVNTTSYKSNKQTFGSLLRMSEVRPDTPNSDNLLAGAGSTINSVAKDMSSGSVNITDKNTDFYIQDSGYFAVRDNTGRTFYTRDGNFHSVIDANGMHLANAQGMEVLGANGQAVRVAANGNPENPAVFNFNNPAGLSAFGENLYEVSNTSGNAQISATIPYAGALERSNVDLSEEMVNMITSQRGLQLNSRLVQTADNIEDMVNNMGK